QSVFVLLFLFFFSSRRRHTRSTRDWSSDVCSSDLIRFAFFERRNRPARIALCSVFANTFSSSATSGTLFPPSSNCCARSSVSPRSEERRVGKESRSGWWGSHERRRREGCRLQLTHH